MNYKEANIMKVNSVKKFLTLECYEQEETKR